MATTSGGNPQAVIELGDTLIFVVDLVGCSSPVRGGEGHPQGRAADGDPEKAGQPEITVPKTDPPAQLQVQPLIKGKGKEVGPNDTITFDYRWVRWSDGKLLEESYPVNPPTRRSAVCCPGWSRGSPARPSAAGAAGDPACRRLPRRQPHAVGRP